MNQQRTDAFAKLLTHLDLTQLDEMRFEGTSPDNGWKRIYGGQVIAQALIAASRTVSQDRSIHQLHSLFLRLGDVKQNLCFDVTNLRDGKSFSARRVDIKQGDDIICTMTSSFHKEEIGLSHQDPMPEMPRVDQLPSIEEIKTHVLAAVPSVAPYFSDNRPIEMIPVNVDRFIKTGPLAPLQAHWIKPAGDFPDDPIMQKALLSFASDYSLLDTALIAHDKHLVDPTMMMATIDHGMWFHRPTHFSNWHLYIQKSPTAQGGRGIATGQIFNQDGDLVATTFQEGLMRQVSPNSTSILTR